MLNVQADTSNHIIRRIDIAYGSVTTLAGLAGTLGSTDGIGSNARLFYPQGVTMDATGGVAIVVSRNEGAGEWTVSVDDLSDASLSIAALHVGEAIPALLSVRTSDFFF